ncbi:MAG TPA: OsmC family protein [Kofleriaceae bacterium]|nr:OsmC family protein [Kofleriaceae bacterium]
MAEHRATIDWQSTATPADFVKGRYARGHTWSFDGGITIAGSPSPSVVPAPWSTPAAVDPEEAYVAAIASCHMLSFLYVAAKAGFVVTAYRDEAIGVMAKNARGQAWVSKVTLAPAIAYGDKAPSADELAHLHHLAHEECFIANSVNTEIVVA